MRSACGQQGPWNPHSACPEVLLNARMTVYLHIGSGQCSTRNPQETRAAALSLLCQVPLWKHQGIGSAMGDRYYGARAAALLHGIGICRAGSSPTNCQPPESRARAAALLEVIRICRVGSSPTMRWQSLDSDPTDRNSGTPSERIGLGQAGSSLTNSRSLHTISTLSLVGLQASWHAAPYFLGAACNASSPDSCQFDWERYSDTVRSSVKNHSIYILSASMSVETITQW